MRVEWNVGIGDGTSTGGEPTCTTTTLTTAGGGASSSNILLLPDVDREGNGEIKNIPFGETALMQQPQQASHSNGNYFACSSSTGLSSHSNGTSTHSPASSTVGLSRSSPHQPQHLHHHIQQHQVTISSQQTPTPGLVSTDLSSSGVEQSTHEPTNNSYKGIFLVDGLGHGVRIDNTNNRIGGPSSNTTTATQSHTDPSLNLCGLPTLMTSVGVNNEMSSTTGAPAPPNAYSYTNNAMTTTSPGSTSLVSPNNYLPNPVCIQINANNNPTTPSISSPPIFLADSANSVNPNNRMPATSFYDGSNVNNTISNVSIPNSSVTPVRVTCNNDTSPLSNNTVITNVPKPNNSNVADFSCSPPPSTSLLLPFPSSPPIQGPSSDSFLGHNITISTPHSSPSNVNSNNSVLLTTERTLISTEAQTEDLPVLVPPPLPQRNREQRKRERRERRREANNQQSSSINREPINASHNSPSRSTSTSTAPFHHPSQRHNNSNARDAALQQGPSQNHPTTDERSEIHNRNVASPASNNTPHLDPSLIPYGLRSNMDNIGLPDLLNSHLPPPYSTLPQHCEPRRPVMGNVPITMLSPHPVPLLPPPQILAPPTCLQAPPQPVRYHFSPTNRASRRSMRATRGLPYASEEEPKSCCGMSTSQAVSIRWFIIVIAAIGICCTVAGTALGAARSAGKEHLTLSLLMIGVGVVLLTVSAVAWRLTANETGTSCRTMLGFARSGSSRGDGGSEPNRRFVPRLAPSYGRPHHPYAAMMYPDFQYRPPPPSYQASMQEYRLRLLLLERSNPTIAAAASLASPAALTMFPPPPAYRPYNGVMRPPPTTNNRNDTDYSRPPSYRSRSSGNSGAADGNNAVHSAMESGNGQLHIMMDSPHHSRDPSLISYLSQQSILENGSGVSGTGGNIQQGGNHNVTTTVVTVMQTVSVGMGLELDMSGLGYDPNATGSEHTDENKEYPNQGEVGDSEKKSIALGAKSNVNSNDGNLVRIVQTTDSSQVIGRDSVIVTVSGSNHSLWSQSLHHSQNNDHNNSPATAPPRNNLSENGEVQILAHL